MKPLWTVIFNESSRVFLIWVLPVRSPEGKKELQQIAERILPPGEAGTFNQALMDLGAAICTPRSPLCPGCPLNTLCQSYEKGTQNERPVLEKRPAIPIIRSQLRSSAGMGYILSPAGRQKVF